MLVAVAPARGTLTGLVKDGAGNPIANAVVLTDLGYSGASDAAGRYTLLIESGAHLRTRNP